MKHDGNYYAKRPHQHGEKERRHRHRSKSVFDSRPPVLANALDLPSLPSGLQTEKTVSDRKHHASVFSSITSAEEESAASKKRKSDSASTAVNRSSPHISHQTTSNGDHNYYYKNAVAKHDYESSDEDRHFKRRRSRYESSPSPSVKEGRHSSRGSREKGVIAATVGRLSAADMPS